MFYDRLGWTIFITGLCAGFSVHAATGNSFRLKDVKIGSSNKIELTFDQRVPIDFTTVDYLPEIIQFSFRNSTIFPAKISSINTNWATKVFSYQYAPDLVRMRLSTKGPAIRYKEGLRTSWKGSVLTLEWVPVGEVPRQEVQIVPPITPKLSVSEKKEMLEKIESSSASTPALVAKKTPMEETSKFVSKTRKDRSPQMSRSLAIMAFFIAIVSALAFLITRATHSSKSSKLSRFLKGIAGQSDGVYIEILSRQSLGPKKSIVVAKVKDRTLVLGMADSGISLITEFDDDLEEHKEKSVELVSNPVSSSGSRNKKSRPLEGPEFIERKIPASAFDEVLRQTDGKSAKSQILSRLEGMKRL